MRVRLRTGSPALKAGARQGQLAGAGQTIPAC
ncbi:hypothetical protein RA210_U10657 [Rubrivivax sp. A210]|nr:hypothetical protein RA210_U10657 [Rubrivivax sp. A210]